MAYPPSPLSPATVTGADENQVTGVRVTAGVKELTVMWNPVAGATGYTVTLLSAGGSEPYTTTRTRTVIRELTAGTQYSVTVTADVPDATGEPIPQTPAVPARPKPGKVSNVEVTVPDDAQQLEVSWGDGRRMPPAYLVQWKSGIAGVRSQHPPSSHGDIFVKWYGDVSLRLGMGRRADSQHPSGRRPVHTVQVIAKAGLGSRTSFDGDPSNPANRHTEAGQAVPGR